MSKINKIITAVSRSFSVPIFSFLIALFGVRFYGKESWGEFIYTFTWILLLAFIASYGNKDYLIRKYSNNPSKIADYFTKNITSRLLLLSLSVIVFVIFPIKTAVVSLLLIISIYFYQSLNSLIIYHQLFLKQLIAETLGFTIIVGYFLLKYDYNLEMILCIYVVAYLLKISIFFGDLKHFFIFKKARISIKELKHSFLFFLIVFSGFIASKIDLYVVNITMTKEHISEYQIGITAFLLLQSLAYLIILPFNKHLYRLKTKAINKIRKKLAYVSIPIVLAGTICIWFILERIVELGLSVNFYLIGGLSSIPVYFFIIDIMILYKLNKEKTIIKVSFIGALIKLVAILYFTKIVGITGGIISVLIFQLVLLVLFKIFKENDE